MPMDPEFVAAKSKLEPMELKLRTVIESVPNGIVMVDGNGIISLCNSEMERMFGYEKSELVGKPIEILVPPKYRHGHAHLRESYATSPSKRRMGAGRDLAGIRKDGTEFSVEIGLNPLLGSDGFFTIASVLDITERKKIETRLQAAYEEVHQRNLEMEQFVYAVSHDLKAPLVTSVSFLGFLKEDIEKQNYQDVPDSLSRVEKAHRKMQQLIEDLLQLSRVGRMEMQIELVDLSNLLMEVQDDLQESLSDKHIELVIPSGLPTVPADRKRMIRAFENLINNAIKYASDVPNPKIQIIWRETPRTYEMAVKDNGPGINKQFHKKIFGLFQRLNSDKEGTGVGLTIVSRIAEMHGGAAWVESEEGAGAEFWISLSKEGPKGRDHGN